MLSPDFYHRFARFTSHIINEAVETQPKTDLKSSVFAPYLEFNGAGKLVGYRYSDRFFPKLSVRDFGKAAHSKAEVRTWSRPRLFFYTNPQGYMGDVRGIDTTFQYIASFDAAKIYPLEKNASLVNPEAQADGVYGTSFFEKKYLEIAAQGYKGMIYSWNDNYANPILIYFEDVAYDAVYKNGTPYKHEYSVKPVGSIDSVEKHGMDLQAYVYQDEMSGELLYKTVFDRELEPLPAELEPQVRYTN